MLVQDLWRNHCEWDGVINDKFNASWEAWLEGARKIGSICIPRQFTTDKRPITEIQLHIFCDASEKAYGCVAYVRFSYKGGGHSTSFVMSKSRLAPIK